MLDFLAAFRSNFCTALYYVIQKHPWNGSKYLIHWYPEKFKSILPNLKDKKKLKWNNTIAGGQKSTDFQCIAYIDGLPGSKIYFSGKREEDSGKNVYSEFVLEF